MLGSVKSHWGFPFRLHIAAIYLHLDTGQIGVKFGVNLTCKCTEMRAQSIIVFPRGSSVLFSTLKASWLVVRPLSFCVYPRIYLALTESQQSRAYSVREEERRLSCTIAIAIVHWSVQAGSDLQSLQVDMKQISSTFLVFSKNRSNFYMYQVNSLGKSQWFPLALFWGKGVMWIVYT